MTTHGGRGGGANRSKTRPLARPCLTCGKFTTGGRCPDCKRAEQKRRDLVRGSAGQRGYDQDGAQGGGYSGDSPTNLHRRLFAISSSVKVVQRRSSGFPSIYPESSMLPNSARDSPVARST